MAERPVAEEAPDIDVLEAHDPQAPEIGAAPVGMDAAEAARAVIEPLWKVRLRLLRKSSARNWALFSQNKIGMFGLAIILLFAVIAIAHPILMATVWEPRIYDPVIGFDAPVIEITVVEEVTDPITEIEFQQARLMGNPFVQVGDVIREAAQPAPPTFTGDNPHLLGTDALGRDVLSQLMFGARTAFLLGGIAALTVLLVSTTVGSVAAYFGGRTDSILMRTADLILMMPLLPVLIVLNSMWGMNIVVLGIMIGVFSGFGAEAIVLKSQALQVSVKPFVDSARVSGGSHRHLIFRHIVPNVMPLAFLYVMFTVTAAVAIESTLSFLGLLPIQMSWGVMVNVAQTFGYFLRGMETWWLVLPAGLAITLLCFGFYLVGRAMDEIINPRLRGR